MRYYEISRSQRNVVREKLPGNRLPASIHIEGRKPAPINFFCCFCCWKDLSRHCLPSRKCSIFLLSPPSSTLFHRSLHRLIPQLLLLLHLHLHLLLPFLCCCFLHPVVFCPSVRLVVTSSSAVSRQARCGGVTVFRLLRLPFLLLFDTFPRVRLKG
jgi:hypothetical protein